MAVVGCLAVTLLGALSAPASAPAGALTNAQLSAKELTISDMPPGWSVSTLGGTAAPLKCFEREFEGALPQENSAEEVSVAYRQNDSLPLVEEDIGWAARGSSKDYDLVVKGLRACKKPFDMTVGPLSGRVHVERVPFPSFGDRSTAFAMGFSFRYQGRAWDTGSDLVVFQVGRVVGLMLYGELGIPLPSQTSVFFAAAVDKIEGKPTTTLANP
jgi:hypothetical protein